MGYEAQHIKLNRGSNNKYSLSRVPYGIRIDCIIRIVLAIFTIHIIVICIVLVSAFAGRA